MTFLVRRSMDDPKDWSMSVFIEGKVKHWKIHRHDDGFSFFSTKSTNLIELVELFSRKAKIRNKTLGRAAIPYEKHLEQQKEFRYENFGRTNIFGRVLTEQISMKICEFRFRKRTFLADRKTRDFKDFFFRLVVEFKSRLRWTKTTAVSSSKFVSTTRKATATFTVIYWNSTRKPNTILSSKSFRVRSVQRWAKQVRRSIRVKTRWKLLFPKVAHSIHRKRWLMNSVG